MLQPVTAARKYTVDDLLALGEDTRCELIHGEIVERAAANWPHSSTGKAALLWSARRFDRRPGVRWPGGWWIAPEIHVLYGVEDTFCHDIAGWRRDRVAEMSRSLMKTRPDWVCEVLSPTHRARDLVDKLGVLHVAGVPDYWVVDEDERMLMMYQHTSAGYVMQTARSGDVIHARPFDAVELRVACVFGDEDDEE
ncbi:MAG: Uma2 family endonuclease [Deltaproteobacteria bacterium]|nr:Uma2 family endonuclease [Deltaproteobacteria bacterium]